jgi:hypothetical protein
MDHVLGRRHFHDLGKLMLAMVMVWAYFNFSQYLIIYSGNIPEETVWFIKRSTGGWGWMAWALILFHFAVPFLILLQQDLKRKPRKLAAVAIFILFMRLVDLFFYIGPSRGYIRTDRPRRLSLVGWTLLPDRDRRILGRVLYHSADEAAACSCDGPFLENAIEHGHGH